MKISISKIKPSPLAIRKTWDKEKMHELTKSIKEQGIIVPLKVRQINSKYDIVYGHRRLEAARRAGFDEIECIVEGMDDFSAMDQAITENVAREDMVPTEIGEALRSVKEQTGWNNEEIGNRYAMHHTRVQQLIALTKEPDEIKKMVSSTTSKISEHHVREVRQGLGLDDSTRSKILDKAETEGLTSAQTRRVAEAIAVAPSEKAKQQLLEREYTPTIHDPEWIGERAKRHGAHDPIYRFDDKKSDTDWRQAPEVKAITDAIITWQKLIGEFQKTADAGKMAPEARQFIANRARRVAKELVEWADELENEP